MSAEHVPMHWRRKTENYRLQGKAQLTQNELNLILAEGASLSQILDCTREQLEKLFPDLVQDESPQELLFLERELMAAR